jgi:NAD(P)-dependent dehydrogenase (short-subunit alcohol dehydrogenase family)
MSTDSSPIWFITGVSTGFGNALAHSLLKRGYRVIGTVRKQEQIAPFEAHSGGRAKAVLMDVTDASQVHEGIQTALAAFGKIDVLVNNAGYALLGAVEELSEEDIRRQIETNLFGTLAVTRAILPAMRERRSGHIVNITSVGGFVGGAGWGIYCASKFGVEGFSDCLSLELAPLGIHVMIVEPGAFRTSLGSSGTTKTEHSISDYEGSVGKTRAWRAGSAGKEDGDPMKAAQAIIDAVEAENPPSRLVLGKDAVEAIRQKMSLVTAELDKWEAVSHAMDFDN